MTLTFYLHILDDGRTAVVVVFDAVDVVVVDVAVVVDISEEFLALFSLHSLIRAKKSTT